MFDTEAPFALVVDDDAMILVGACEILEAAGFQCLEAYDANEALQRLEEYAGRVALMFTDVDLGVGQAGFALATEVDQRWPDIGILVASGQRVPDPDALPEGAVFIRKPISAQVFHDRLQELLPDGQKPEALRRQV